MFREERCGPSLNEFLSHVHVHGFCLVVFLFERIGLKTPNFTQPMEPEKNSLNFIFPTKYVIPKSLSRLAIGQVSNMQKYLLEIEMQQRFHQKTWMLMISTHNLSGVSTRVQRYGEGTVSRVMSHDG